MEKLHLSARLYFASVFTVSLYGGAAGAQMIIKRDPVIASMVGAVSEKNIKMTIQQLVSFKTRHTMSDTLSKVHGVGAARDWIKKQFEQSMAGSAGRLTVSFDTFTQPADGKRVLKATVMKNVIAKLKGTDTSDRRVLLISGHYDSRALDVNDALSDAPGAVDDASGTALVLELARIMSKHSYPSTILFVAMIGEEQGLFGATHLAKRAQDEKWPLNAMFTNDIVGNTYGMETGLKDNMSVRVFSEGPPTFESAAVAAQRSNIGSENDGNARQLARYVKEMAERYVANLHVKLIYRKDRYLRGGDHTPFSASGFAAVRLSEPNEDFRHQHQNVVQGASGPLGDLPEYADYDYIRKVAQLNLATVANLALAPAKPLQVKLIATRLTNKTELQWNQPQTRSGFYVLVRETDQPMWERKIFTTENKIVLDYSKDNYFFAVQSVDADGHESLPVVPLP